MQKRIICVISVILVSSMASLTRKPCRVKEEKFGYVCVNDEKYCDTLDVPEEIANNEYLLVTSSKNKDRFVYETGKIECGKLTKTLVDIDSSKRYQTMQGFGGGYTGSVSHLINNLSPNMQKCLFKSYFSHDVGMRYSYLRVPIGGCDFDLSPWAYNELPENDANLSNFTQLDSRDLIRNRQLKELMRVSKNHGVKILGVNWGPPKWMKEKNDWNGGENNKLKKEYYQTFADYHLKWLDLMHNDGIPIWAISTGNEPASAKYIEFQALYWNAADQAVWIADNLGPTLKNSKYSNIEIHGLDENRDVAPDFIGKMEESDARAFEYITGLQFHAYADKGLEPHSLDNFQDKFPDKQIWYTEMCFGAFFMTQHIGPRLGTWDRAQSLVNILIENLSHSTVGYIDWNILLDHNGGPSYMNNQVDAQIILSEDGREMYKQPTFYAMAHFSKFILHGSIRIEANILSPHISKVKSLAFLRPDNKIVVILYNRAFKTIFATIRDKSKGIFNIKLKPKSINTLVYAAGNDKPSCSTCKKCKNSPKS